MIAINVAAAMAREQRTNAGVLPAICGTGSDFACAPKDNPLISQDVHHSAGSHAVLWRCQSGSPARQMSPMIWNGNQMLTMGTIQPQNAQPGARRCR